MVKRIKKTIVDESQMMKAPMEYITDSIYFKDLESRVIRVNKACAEKYRIKDTDEAIGKTDFNFFSEEHAKQAYKDEQCIIKTGRPRIDIEEKETWHGKTYRWVSTTKMPFYDRDGNIVGTFGISRDITDKKKAEEKVEYLSFHDTLTGMYNRAYFEEELKRLDTERQLPITMVMGDVNGLKMINDAYGHEKGDIFLKKIAEILKDCFRKEDIISRWGGDEFIIILPKTTAKDTRDIIRRIKKTCRERSTLDMPLSISLGVSIKRKQEDNIVDILKEAEDKMYKKKISESKPVQESLIESLKESLKKDGEKSEEEDRKKKEYALLLARKLKLSSLKLEELKLLLNLHNIGKLTLVEEVMSKRGRLTKEEWKVIKEIPLIGYRIAESSALLKPIAEAILSHHEWYDGSGYPMGIKGEEIPILSRISFLINSYEAMISDRPYRRKMTKKQAIEEIKRYSGKQFDPKIARLFVEILKKEERILKNRFKRLTQTAFL
jgi:diguanylate cyclase (GGDEF)-like protein/PAS domain S-box-containing protein